MRLYLFVGIVFLPLFVIGQTDSQHYRDSLERAIEKIKNLEKEQGGAETVAQKVDLLCLLSKITNSNAALVTPSVVFCLICFIIIDNKVRNKNKHFSTIPS